MCGIIGYSVIQALPDLEAGLAAIAHRGPDGLNCYVNKSLRIGLGHARLAIVDLSNTGRQPMATDDGAFILIYNGELYNYAELRAELEAGGVRFNGTSDTEIVLRLLTRDGERALNKLNGMFALALLDAQTGDLLLARDGMGIKPLYFAQTTSGVFFSSELKGLVGMGVALGDVNPSAIDKYLTYSWNPGDDSPALAINRLGPGEALRVRAGAVIEKWSWFDPPSLSPKARSVSEAPELIERTTSLLREAVHRQMISDVPVGAFLSGGLDSSAVVAFAREVVPNIQCFTIEPSGGEDVGVAADLPYARQVAAHLNVPLEVVKLSPEDLMRDLEKLVFHLDEPIADPAPLNVLYICNLARTLGIKVLLSGTGGDDLFAGYRRHEAIKLLDQIDRTPRFAIKVAQRLAQSLGNKNAFLRRINRLLYSAELRGNERIADFFVWTRRDDLERLYTADFAAALSARRTCNPLLEYLGQLPSSSSNIDRVLALEQRFFLADHNLLYTDKMSMAAGVEVRVPFLDRDLVAFAATIPHELKLKNNCTKWILKKALAQQLPAEVIYRPKTGFGAPLRRWIKQDLAEHVDDFLSESNVRARGFFKPEAVRMLISRNAAGQLDASYTIYALLCIEVWCRTFLDSAEVNQ